MSAENSSRFLIQMIMNVYICGFAQKKLAKISSKKEGKRAFKSYMAFLIFAIVLIGLNQLTFFLFTPNNIYQELGIPRSYSIDDVKKHKEDLKVKIMSMDSIPIEERLANIKKMESMADVLTHPARRLSYDTFGETDTSFAWAFKSQFFLLSTIIGSSIFYVICTILNMIGSKKGQIKEAYKMEILVMIVLFLWEVELIMKTENRIHSHTDALDNIYTAFPIHERRQMIKIILIPCMNIIKFFFRFFIQSQSEKKFLQIAKNPKLIDLTKKVSESVRKQVDIKDEHLEDKIGVALSTLRKDSPAITDIYELQRKTLIGLLYIEGDNILMDEEIMMLLNYFQIKVK